MLEIYQSDEEYAEPEEVVFPVVVRYYSTKKNVVTHTHTFITSLNGQYTIMLIPMGLGLTVY